MTIAGSIVRTAEEGGFVAPGPGSFDLPPVFTVGGYHVTNVDIFVIPKKILHYGNYGAPVTQAIGSAIPGGQTIAVP